MKDKALKLLRRMLNNDANFHQGQWESIESALANNRTLVVQKTGWGKSVVYFIATKLLREQGKGTTLLISPLLSLMRNQMEAAKKIGIRAETINSDNIEDWDRVEEVLKNGQCDILLLSPERLGNDDFVSRILPAIKGGIGTFVIDEAHCISDWGHDFRPDYRRIVRIINSLPPNIPVIATTATANERVINDIKEQLGNELKVIRGPLTRESLRLQSIKLGSQAERLAWLYENINKMEGSGIIYCLTTSDCNRVARWLQHKGINALPYHSNLSQDNSINRNLSQEREQMLLDNKVKALVSTVKLGMGFDKPDIGFVIHFQRPGSVVKYYQEIGRAGRALDHAYAVLLSGQEDDQIEKYFIDSAFPTEKEMSEIVEIIENSENGLKESAILKEVNISLGRVRKCLKGLQMDHVVTKEKNIYSRTLNPWKPDIEKSNFITKLRYDELDKMKQFVELDSCYMKFISMELDDVDISDCGKCTNCTELKYFDDQVKDEDVVEAINFIQGEHFNIKVRKQWPAGVITSTVKKIPEGERNIEGKVLCTYGDAGWGKYVKEDRWKNNYFRDELVKASEDLLRSQWNKEWEPTWVTSISSLRRPELVKTFAQRLAVELGLPYKEVIRKKNNTPEQKTLGNSFLQSSNALDGFEVSREVPSGPVLLVDDLVESGWTLTVCGVLLRRSGSGEVYPYALASTSKAEGGNE